ncbi:MAG: hypothetical protein J1E60_02650 [Christensenellaceae bacterium]|nr:hypothetical protein [Christensenellaceae bacterium]
MYKKLLSFSLVLVVLFTTFSTSVLHAQSTEDIINSIPIVEFQLKPETKSSLNLSEYDDAKVILVTKETAYSAKRDTLVSLVRADNTVFFKDMLPEEVKEITGLDFLVEDYDNELNVEQDEINLGTSLTMVDDVYQCIHSTIVSAQECAEPCEECGAVGDSNAYELIVEASDYDYAARSAYANAKIFELSEPKGFPPLADYIYARSITVKYGLLTLGQVGYTLNIYRRGKATINDVQRKVYDCIASVYSSPKSIYRVTYEQCSLGVINSSKHAFLDQSQIKSQGISATVNCSLSNGVDGVSWKFDLSSFFATNNFSSSKEKMWKIVPVFPGNGDSWGFQPGVRCYAVSSSSSTGKIIINVTGLFSNCSMLVHHLGKITGIFGFSI